MQFVFNYLGQLKVVAKDNGNPQRTAMVTIVIKLVRNPNGPVFTQNFYSGTVGEYAPIHHMVLNVEATDADPKDVSKHIGVKIP